MSMRVRKSAVVGWSLTASALLLAGCGGSSVAGAPPTATTEYTVAGIRSASLPSFAGAGVGSLRLDLQIRPDAKTQILYVSQFVSSLYYGFKLPHTTAFCTSPFVLHTTVNSIATTADGTEWLPTQGAPSGIYAYAPNCGSQVNLLSVPPKAQPVGVVFDGSGTAYGLMTYVHQGYNTATVEVYPKGATSPKDRFTDARLKVYGRDTVDGIGVDAKGKVYVTCCGGASPFIIIFTGKRSHKQGQQVFLKGIAFLAGSISFDKSGNMLVPDLNSSALAVYAPPYSGTPTAYALKGKPWQCGLNSAETEVSCANQSAATADIYSYPSMAYQYSVAPQGSGLMVGGTAFVPSH